ncbi:MAG: sugar transferase [Eubacteriales bacterium]|nr:sugar transferase [Eubacteriales bacterium]
MNTELLTIDLDVPDEKIINLAKGQKKIKRLMDILISVIVLVFASPILFVACIAIMVESKWSPIYRQERNGYLDRPFVAFKLRTMYADSSIGNLSAPKEGEPRVTKVGKFLRKTSIDELPQFVNVLLGDMSILGPRAVPKKELELRVMKMTQHNPDGKNTFERAMKIRSMVLPGISGMAQAYGRSSNSIEQATEYDVFYVLNYTLMLDVRIFFKSIETVLFRRGVN